MVDKSRKEQFKLHFMKNWKWYILGTLLAGFIIELLNHYWWRWWIYLEPWMWSPNAFFPFGTITILGWVVMAFSVLILHMLLKFFFPKGKTRTLWIISWVIMGYIYEAINIFIWRTWTYNPPWSHSIFALVPILGYGVTGVITGFTSYYLIMFIKRRVERRKNE